MRHLWVVLMVLLLLSGCSEDPIQKLINGKFPPVTPDQQRKTAIDTTAIALTRVTTPSLAFGIKWADAAAALLDERLRKEGVTELELKGEQQLLRAHVTFRRTFTGKDVGDGNPALKSLIETLRPEVEGKLVAYAGVTSALVTPSSETPELGFSILPAVGTLEVTSLKLAARHDVASAAEAVISVLQRYKDNISGELSRKPFTRVSIPALAPKAFDFSQTFSLSSPAARATVAVTASPVRVPVKLSGVAWLISDAQIVSLVQLLPVEAELASPAIDAPARTYDAVRDQITGLLRTSFDLRDEKAANWVAVRKDLLAGSLNSIVRQANLCATVSGSTERERASTKVKLPNGASIDCSPTRDCTPTRNCDFQANHDTRDCRICLIPRIFGRGCAQWGNNPLCETAKATQNNIYEAARAAKKFDCERIKSQDKLTCEAEKKGAKLLCEAGKETLNLIAATGNFGNLDVASAVKADDLRVCLKDFAVSPALDNVALTLDAQGQANANVDVKFTPLDIVGHLACQFPWTESQNFKASLRENRLQLSSKVRLETAPGASARAVFSLDEVPIKAKLSPGPTEFLLKSTNMTLACQGMNLMKPLFVALTPFVPELKGEVSSKLPKQDVTAKLALPAQHVGEAQLTIELKASELAVIGYGTRNPPGL